VRGQLVPSRPAGDQLVSSDVGQASDVAADRPDTAADADEAVDGANRMDDAAVDRSLPTDAAARGDVAADRAEDTHDDSASDGESSVNDASASDEGCSCRVGARRRHSSWLSIAGCLFALGCTLMRRHVRRT
jgi:hypothetical protein